jgi:N-acetylmuramoyl-L-alanine amidase
MPAYPRIARATGAALLGILVTSSAAATAAHADDNSRARAYADAAAATGVPESVLLGVSYLESRWDTNAGQPSVSAGYGPMHLTDAAYVDALAAPAQALTSDADSAGPEDARGDESRPASAAERPAVSAPADKADAPTAAAMQTMDAAAALTGQDKAALREDAGANIRGGAALLASYQRDLGLSLSSDPAQWYAAVARYSGAADADTAATFADEVFATIAAGAARVTDDGYALQLPATASAAAPVRAQLDRLHLTKPSHPDQLECPVDVGCEWVPAPYEQYGPDAGDYGNYDLSDRPHNEKIDYIVIHATEGSYQTALNLVQDPTYLGWHYTIRSSDGHVAQHIQTKNVGWHAGNWDVNSRSVGIEHEGYSAAQGAWYTEAMYQASAKLVRYLALRLGIPLDRQHILGHDNVPGITTANIAGMHWDPGPYWDWSHYFTLLKAPFKTLGNANSGLVQIDPDFATNKPAYTGCTGKSTNPCPLSGSSEVILHNAPSATAPLLNDRGLRSNGTPETMVVSDMGARASAGQVYAIADQQGDWTAIWYLGQKGWFYNPASNPVTHSTVGFVAVPKAGKATIPVYGRAYPEAAAYAGTGVPVQAISPLVYTFAAGQRYAVGGEVAGQYYRAVTFAGTNPGDWTVISGDMKYIQIQFGHRIAFVNADDVDVIPAVR